MKSLHQTILEDPAVRMSRSRAEETGRMEGIIESAIAAVQNSMALDEDGKKLIAAHLQSGDLKQAELELKDRVTQMPKEVLLHVRNEVISNILAVLALVEDKADEDVPISSVSEQKLGATGQSSLACIGDQHLDDDGWRKKLRCEGELIR